MYPKKKRKQKNYVFGRIGRIPYDPTILYDPTRFYVRSYHFYDSSAILIVLVRWDRKIVRSYDPDRDFDNHAYSCPQEVPGGARWDRKKSSEPNLHVCGEDGTQRGVYKLKEEHAERGAEQKKKRKKNTEKRRRTKREKKNCIDYQRKRSLCHLQTFNIREGESFYDTKVNLVLYTHALQIILLGPIYVRAQYRVGSLQIVSLQ